MAKGSRSEYLRHFADSLITTKDLNIDHMVEGYRYKHLSDFTENMITRKALSSDDKMKIENLSEVDAAILLDIINDNKSLSEQILEHKRISESEVTNRPFFKHKLEPNSTSTLNKQMTGRASDEMKIDFLFGVCKNLINPTLKDADTGYYLECLAPAGREKLLHVLLTSSSSLSPQSLEEVVTKVMGHWQDDSQ